MVYHGKVRCCLLRLMVLTPVSVISRGIIRKVLSTPSQPYSSGRIDAPICLYLVERFVSQRFCIVQRIYIPLICLYGREMRLRYVGLKIILLTVDNRYAKVRVIPSVMSPGTSQIPLWGCSYIMSWPHCDLVRMFNDNRSSGSFLKEACRFVFHSPRSWNC